MHDHNLDDLIIDNIEPKNSKTKSFLTIIALMIVVLIVAIILTKILLKTPNNNDLAFEQDDTEMIAPELKLKEPTKTPEIKKESTISRMIESEPKAPIVETKKSANEEAAAVQEEGTEPVLSNIAEKEIQAPDAEPAETPKEDKDASDIAYWESVQEKRKAAQMAKEETSEETSDEVATEAAQVTERITPKKVPVQNTPKPIVKPVAVKSKPNTMSNINYFVQVGAYRNDPGTRFISVIRNNGYQYRMTKPDAKGLKKVLIGPYNDKASASRALHEIKERISKRAFIVKE